MFKAVEGKWLEGRYFVYVGRDYAYTSHTQIDPKEPNNSCPVWIYILYATVVKVCIHISNTHNVIPIQHSPNENCEVPLLGLKLSSSAYRAAPGTRLLRDDYIVPKPKLQRMDRKCICGRGTAAALNALLAEYYPFQFPFQLSVSSVSTCPKAG